MSRAGLIISCDTRAMMGSNERDLYFSIEQRQFAAKMTDCIRLRQLCRITRDVSPLRQLNRTLLRVSTCAFPDFDRVADVIGMAVRDQDEIDVFERGDFVLGIFENRIR